jgi:hypothetical protein
MAALPEEVKVVEESPHAIRYLFPKRELGPWRWIAWGMIGIGAAFAYWMLRQPLVDVVRNRPGVANLIVLAFWSWLACAILWFVLRYPLALLFGRREVELEGNWLRAGERFGSRRRMKSWNLKRLKSIQVVDLWPLASSEAVDAKLSPNLNALTGVLDDGKRFVIVAGYPRHLIEAFYEELTARYSAAHQGHSIGSAPLRGLPEVLKEAADAAERPLRPDVWQKPARSLVEQETFPDGVTLRVPPLGIRRGSAGLYHFSIVWWVAIFLFTALFAFAGGGHIADVFKSIAVMSPFWLAGAGMFLAAWNMGKREAVIAVVGPTMMVLQTGLFGSRRREWPQSEIRTVMLGPSGMEVNDKPVLELQIQGKSQKLLGLMSGRDERELAWMATVLRHALHPPAPSATDAPIEIGEGNVTRAAAGQSGARAFDDEPDLEDDDEVESSSGDERPRSMVRRLILPLLAGGALIWGGLYLWNEWLKLAPLLPQPPAAPARAAQQPVAAQRAVRIPPASPGGVGANPNRRMTVDQPSAPVLGALPGMPPARRASAPIRWSARPDPPAPQQKITPTPDLRVPIPAGLNTEIFFPDAPATSVCVGTAGNGHDYREVWDLAARRKLGSTRGLRTMFADLNGYFRTTSTLGPDGKYFVTQGMDPIRLVVWDVAAEKLVGELPVEHGGTASLHFARFCGPGRVLVGGIGLPTQLFAIPSLVRERVSTFPEPAVLAPLLAVSPAGRYIAAYPADPEKAAVRIQDIATDSPAGELNIPVKAELGNIYCKALAFSTDGGELAGLFDINAKSQLLCWSMMDGKPTVQIDFGAPLLVALKSPQAYLHPLLEWFPKGNRWLVHGQGIVDREAGELVWIIPDQASFAPRGIRHVLDDGHLLVHIKVDGVSALGLLDLPIRDIQQKVDLAKLRAKPAAKPLVGK